MGNCMDKKTAITGITKTLSLRRRFLSTKDFPYICFYCGDPGDNKEHVFPKTYYGEQTPKVWSCGECNSIAGYKVFNSIYDKRDYIHQGIESKYQPILNMPDWSTQEIAELGPGLRSLIISSQHAREWLKGRLGWKYNADVMVATKILSQSVTGSDFARTVAGTPGIKLSVIESMISIEKKDTN